MRHLHELCDAPGITQYELLQVTTPVGIAKNVAHFNLVETNYWHKNHSDWFQLNAFSVQLSQNPIEVSLCGLTTLNLGLTLSVSWIFPIDTEVSKNTTLPSSYFEFRVTVCTCTINQTRNHVDAIISGYERSPNIFHSSDAISRSNFNISRIY